ncbi:UDP-glucose 6-dehydrogenase [Dissulfurispira thermophila]|uniref:UDP-glucose 6-dehydrogenase n=1 Tax=Dissulfurispira thermophila TaxID=2715679 RepID=A0A7G1H340_9BACT|nr:UDP-glucose/GDP-mannose dehydrogenase family protein [Dissulfurispira thermophila]BCB97220.1 UDP-glucose 6-dehydrogenase [Dissulfurispira thermophila]
MHITIIGTGYVGLVTGACFSEFGVFVTCVDKDKNKIESLKNGTIPFYEPGLEDIVKRNFKQGRLKFSTDIGEAVEESLVIFIAVGTPPRGDGSADLSYVDNVAEEIANHIKSYKVIVTKSTVPVGTGERIRKIISEHLQQTQAINTADNLFDVVSNPEFLREGAAIEDFMRPNRVVIGAESQQAIAIMKDLYRPLYLIETPFVITNIKTAELIKYASNSFLATKISFINEMANLCEKVGADVNVVAKGMGLDRRIGPKFLHAGPGFGGSCFPKDTKALLRIASEHNVELGIVDAAIRANERQITVVSEKIKTMLNDIKGKTIAILGLSFKPNTDDIREAPAISIIKNLLNAGANIRAYDPVAMENTKIVFPDITYCKDAYDACSSADAVVIITEWNQFRNLDLERIMKLLKQPYFFDLRNIYEPQKMKALGFNYYSIGR